MWRSLIALFLSAESQDERNDMNFNHSQAINEVPGSNDLGRCLGKSRLCQPVSDAKKDYSTLKHPRSERSVAEEDVTISDDPSRKRAEAGDVASGSERHPNLCERRSEPDANGSERKYNPCWRPVEATKIETLTNERPKRNERAKLSAFAVMAVFAVAAGAVLLDFRRIAVATVSGIEVQVHQLGAIELLLSAPEHTAEHTSKPRNNFHTIVLSPEIRETSSRIFQLLLW